MSETNGTTVGAIATRPRSWLLAAGLAALLLVAVATPAFADFYGEYEEDPGPPADNPSRASEFNGYLHWTIRSQEHPDEPGERCWAMVATRSDDPPQEYQTYETQAERLAAWDVSGIAYEACPERIDPALEALRLWVAVAIDGVDVSVPPGFGLAGMPAYVLLDGPEQLGADTSAGGVTISISAHPTYTIDFGDGSEPVTTTSQGVAYPGGDGEIVHIYTDAANRTITVTTEWNATFTTPGGTVDLPARSTVDTHEFEVHEYRAVRTGDR